MMGVHVPEQNCVYTVRVEKQSTSFSHLFPQLQIEYRGYSCWQARLIPVFLSFITVLVYCFQIISYFINPHNMLVAMPFGSHVIDEETKVHSG